MFQTTNQDVFSIIGNSIIGNIPYLVLYTNVQF